MEATTREIAFLIEKLIDAGLDPLRREGVHTDAAARRVLRCSSINSITNCCFGCLSFDAICKGCMRAKYMVS